MAVRSRATLLAMGGGPTMYKVIACSADKAADGIALALHAGAPMKDMEMVQFHPTGLVVPNSLMTGALLEEGLRGAGGKLLNGAGARFMTQYDPERMERSTRDLVARACFTEVQEGRGTPNGGVWIDVSHLGAKTVEANFRGMVRRCRDFGRDLAREPVEVGPTAHFMMGGVVIDSSCRTAVEGLFVAGEDAGGIHGANRLGGNGVADSTVFGGIAGDVMAEWVVGRALPRLRCGRGGRRDQRAARPGARENLYTCRPSPLGHVGPRGAHPVRGRPPRLSRRGSPPRDRRGARRRRLNPPAGLINLRARPPRRGSSPAARSSAPRAAVASTAAIPGNRTEAVAVIAGYADGRGARCRPSRSATRACVRTRRADRSRWTSATDGQAAAADPAAAVGHHRGLARHPGRDVGLARPARGRGRAARGDRAAPA
jgi:hypothetical protein